MSISCLNKKELNPVNKLQRRGLGSILYESFSILRSVDVDSFEMENCRFAIETIQLCILQRNDRQVWTLQSLCLSAIVCNYHDAIEYYGDK